MNDKPWPTLAMVGEARVPVLMNRKCYRKSLENGCPWIVHPATWRVLPWPGSPKIIRLYEGPACYQMELPAGTNLYPYGEALPPNLDPDERTAMNPEGESQTNLLPNDAVRPEETFSEGQGGNILHTLAQVVAERRESMPEGSYTTHLFCSGPDKIRKKLGEEAVELILARERNDVIYESADLIYHLQVLLTALSMDWRDVEAELILRHNPES